MDPYSEHVLPDYFFAHDPTLYPPRNVPFIVDGLLPRSGLVLLAAPPKTGKTDLATALAYAVAKGLPFAGRNVELGPVLLANYEENGRERRDVLSRFAGLPDGPECPDLWHAEGLPGIDTPTGADLLESFCRELFPRLIVIDCLHAAVERSDLSSAKSARRALRGLADLAGRFGTAVLLLHHTDRRGERPGEHLQLQAAVGGTIVVRAEPHPKLPGSRLLNLRLEGRGLGLRGTAHLVTDAPLSYRAATEDDLPRAIPTLDPIDSTSARILAALIHGAATSAALAEILLVPRGTVRSALARLVDRGAVVAPTTENRAHVFTLPSPAATA